MKDLAKLLTAVLVLVAAAMLVVHIRIPPAKAAAAGGKMTVVDAGGRAWLVSGDHVWVWNGADWDYTWSHILDR